jgi:hypothetical protein
MLYFVYDLLAMEHGSSLLRALPSPPVDSVPFLVLKWPPVLTHGVSTLDLLGASLRCKKKTFSRIEYVVPTQVLAKALVHYMHWLRHNP